MSITASSKKISIIIPVLNEAENIPMMLEKLSSWRDFCEVIWVDGGSQDKTTESLKKAQAYCIHSKAGRAYQMNAGASIAKGGLFLFLHADTQLPDYCDSLRKKLEKANWGRFNVKLQGDAQTRIFERVMFHIIGEFINWRSRLTGVATGDQAIFIDQETFNALGGFPSQPLMEDVEICKRLKILSKPECLNEQVITSARRWQKKGIWKTIFLMWSLRYAYWRGTDSSILAKKYR